MVVLILWLLLRVNYDKYICLCKGCHICIAKCCFKEVDIDKIVDNPYYAFEKIEATSADLSKLEMQSTNIWSH